MVPVISCSDILYAPTVCSYFASWKHHRPSLQSCHTLLQRVRHWRRRAFTKWHDPSNNKDASLRQSFRLSMNLHHGTSGFSTVNTFSRNTPLAAWGRTAAGPCMAIAFGILCRPKDEIVPPIRNHYLAQIIPLLLSLSILSPSLPPFLP